MPLTATGREGPVPLLGKPGPGGVSVEDPDLRTQEQENWPHPLLQAAVCELDQAVLESLPRQ